jgi:hypothetical protein
MFQFCFVMHTIFVAAIFFPVARLDLFFLSLIKKNVAPEMLSLYICVGRSSVPVSLLLISY